MYQAVSHETANDLRSLSREKNIWIHDTWDGVLHDVHRLRAFVPSAAAQMLTTYLKRFHRTFYSDSSLGVPCFLKSAGNAPDQLPRREFPPVPPSAESLNVCSVPGLLFVATQDSTYFYLYGWNSYVPLQANQQLIELNKGDIIMLRGDCIYALSGGEATNVVIQAYIDIPSFARPAYQVAEIMEVQDDSRDADDMFCFAWNCPFVAGTKQSLYKHLNSYHQFHFNQPREITP
ncbi:hypothetical protein DVH05_012628 [Phytophthora capsici]|nr:hypothetical protein DVH05_018592 [Phytophthora capsici]KAG1699737.1 hypothetical protein DVH05_012628 [Phytophthora capsici]